VATYLCTVSNLCVVATYDMSLQIRIFTYLTMTNATQIILKLLHILLKQFPFSMAHLILSYIIQMSRYISKLIILPASFSNLMDQVVDTFHEERKTCKNTYL